MFYEKITIKYYDTPPVSNRDHHVCVDDLGLRADIRRDQVNMSKNKEKRIRFADIPNAILEEYCELHGMSPSAALSPLIVEYLRHPSRDARHSSGMNSIMYSHVAADSPKPRQPAKPKTRRKQKTSLPEDFDPPRAISEEAKVDHEKAVRFFKAQAESKDYKYANWDKAFALAVNGYLVDNFPQIKQAPKIKNL